MARLIPLVMIALAVWLWLRARRKTAAYMASHESAADAGARREGRDPSAGGPSAGGPES